MTDQPAAIMAGMPLKRECPLTCLKPLLSGMVYNTLSRELAGNGRDAAPTVGDAADLHINGKLADIPNIGPARISAVETCLRSAGLIGCHHHPSSCELASDAPTGVHRDNGELAQMLGKKLESRGLDVRLATYPDDERQDRHIEQIVVTNPRSPERGEVRVSDDGSVTWEYLGSLDGVGPSRILDEITNALRASGLPVRRRGLICG